MAIQRGDNSNLVPGSGRVLPYWLMFNGVGQFVLPIPPTQFITTMDNYSNVNKSKFGIHLDEWGPQPITIDLSGTFGWSYKDNENGQLSGKQSAWFFVHLKQERDRHIEDGRSNPEDFLITFIATKDGFIADCSLPNLKYTQDKNDPHLYNYQMRLIAVHIKRLFSGLASSDVPVTVAPPDASTVNTTPLSTINPFTLNLNFGLGPVRHTYAVPPGASLNEIATTLYGSTDPAYRQSLTTLNRLPLQPANVPIEAVTLQYRDAQTIVAGSNSHRE